MQQLLHDLAGIAALGAIALPVVFGIWAIAWLRRAVRAGDGTVRTASSGARALGAIAAILGGLLGGQLAGMFGGGFQIGVALGFGVGIGILVWLSSLAGGAVAIRQSRAGVLTLAMLLGPVVLIGGPLAVRSGLEIVANRSAETVERTEVEERSKVLTVTHGSPQAGIYTDNSGRLSLLQMRVTLVSGTEIELARDPASPSPGFIVQPVGHPELALVTPAPQGSPTTLVAGESVSYDLTWSTIGGSVSVQAGGTWQLIVEFQGNGGLWYRSTVEFEMPS